MNKNTKNRLIFIINLVLILAMAIRAIIVNSYSDNEQGIFMYYHLPFGQSIWSGNGYSATFPLWGYPFFVGFIDKISPIVRDYVLSIVQVFMIMGACLWAVRPNFQRLRSVVFTPFFYAIFLHAAVKWADALYVLTLIIIFGGIIRLSNNHNKKLYFVLGIGAALASNIRPDFLYLSFFILLFSLFILLFSKLRDTQFLKSAIVLFLVSIISLVPWKIHSDSFSSYNGGLVFYISLGQLPNNPWQRIYLDGSGFDYTHQYGIEPLTKEGNDLLIKAAINDIREYPTAFVKKILNNISYIFRYGVTGVSQRYFFSVIVLLLIITSFRSQPKLPLLFIWAMLFFTIIWIGVLQYIPRHLNGIYTLIILHIITLPSSENLKKIFNNLSTNRIGFVRNFANFLVENY